MEWCLFRSKIRSKMYEINSDAKLSIPGEPFSAQSAKIIIFWTAQGGNAPPKIGDFEASLGMETWSCTRYWQRSFFENVLPTEGGEHIFIKIAKPGSIFHDFCKTKRNLDPRSGQFGRSDVRPAPMLVNFKFPRRKLTCSSWSHDYNHGSRMSTWIALL